MPPNPFKAAATIAAGSAAWQTSRYAIGNGRWRRKRDTGLPGPERCAEVNSAAIIEC